MIKILIKRIIRYLYKTYINEIYIPDGEVSIIIRRYPSIYWNKYKGTKGQIRTILLKVNQKEKYFFKQSTRFSEDKNGV